MTKKHYVFGTQRYVAPEITLERILPLVDSMGITRVANITGLDKVGIPTVAVYRPNSRSLSVSQGKGVTLLEAKVSGLMESIEGFHAENIQQPLKYCSFEEIKYTHSVSPPADLPSLKDSLYTENRRLFWIEAVDITNEMPTWIPFETVHTDFTWPFMTGSNSFLASTNGLASGNTLTEAMCHAICEVIERDQHAHWMFASDEYRAESYLDIASIKDKRCIDVIEKLRTAGLDVLLFHINHDLDVPAFLCEIHDSNEAAHTRYLPFAGMGCHLNKEIALLRALTEAAQSRLTFISGARDDMDSKYFLFKEKQTIGRDAALFAKRVEHKKSFDTIQSYDNEQYEDDLDQLIAQLEKIGVCNTFVVDLTRPEYEIPVVKVVIPKLESLIMSPNYQPGQRIARFVEEAS